MRALAATWLLLTACSGEPPPARPARSSPTAPASSPVAAAPASSSATALPTASAPASDPALGALIHAPPGATPADQRPFVLFLHGLGGGGRSFATALGVEKLAADKRFYWASPDGTMDRKNRRFWAASSACCDFDHLGADHVASLGALLGEARRTPGVDPARIFVVGFSNGAFMAHRLACSVPGIAGFVSVAGAARSEGDAPCAPSGPVAVLQIHGDADKAVRFEGGHVLDMQGVPAHPSADETMGQWAAANGCAGAAAEKGQLDVVPSLPGNETRDLRYPGCRAPTALWRVVGGDHFIASGRPALELIWGFLDAVPSRSP